MVEPITRDSKNKVYNIYMPVLCVPDNTHHPVPSKKPHCYKIRIWPNILYILDTNAYSASNRIHMVLCRNQDAILSIDIDDHT